MAEESLEFALKYQNGAVIKRFLKRYAISVEEAEDLFNEAKRWLWFCANAPADLDLMINDPMFMLDEMWHEFIVFTQDYTAFCQSRFGRYIHHIPVTDDERAGARAAFAEDPELYREVRRQRFRTFFGAIYDVAGRTTLYKWQVMWREKYSPERRASFAPAPVFDKNIPVVFPIRDREEERFREILYGPEKPRNILIDELVKIELDGTSLWPNHSCGGYCSCSRPNPRTP